MTTNRVKAGLEPLSETSCRLISAISETVDTDPHNTDIHRYKTTICRLYPGNFLEVLRKTEDSVVHMTVLRA